MRVAVADRVGNDGSDGGSCEKLLGVRRESSVVEPAKFQFSQCAPEGVAYYATGSCVLYRLCLCAVFEAVEPSLSGAGLAWLLFCWRQSELLTGVSRIVIELRRVEVTAYVSASPGVAFGFGEFQNSVPMLSIFILGAVLMQCGRVIGLCVDDRVVSLSLVLRLMSESSLDQGSPVVPRLWNKVVRLVSVVQQRYSGGVST
ncbi:hypothetical protein Taro_041210 [Colocasia esculenta]|uniref:Uncharacterized protein n=1 Tax=Colocasia esculenta TaxID=4460 RepID=A0A843WAW5_COLES|nr:hypothetical protein [Colocasia esculenta]